MSVVAINWAWKQRVRATMKLALVALADFADSHGQSCYPGQAELSRMTGIKERAIRTALKDLEQTGLIARTARRYKGRATSDSYRLFCGKRIFKSDSTNGASMRGQPASHANRGNAQPALEAVQAADEAGRQQAHHDVSRERIIIRSTRSDPSVDPKTLSMAAPHSYYPDDFQKFWGSFPRRDAKREALKAWRKLTRDEKALVFADVPLRIVNNWAGRSTDKIPHASTYLNQRRWEDDILANRIVTQAKTVAPDLSPGQELLRQIHSEAVDREQAGSDRSSKYGQSVLAAPTGRPDDGLSVH